MEFELCRIDPARNMRRFDRLDIERDLFGGVMLMKTWGRIGANGRMIAERFSSEEPALAALRRNADSKKRRGQVSISAEIPTRLLRRRFPMTKTPMLIIYALAAAFLLYWHWQHVLDALPFLVVLACPLMHLFMHHGHGHHHGTARARAKIGTANLVYNFKRLVFWRRIGAA